MLFINVSSAIGLKSLGCVVILFIFTDWSQFNNFRSNRKRVK